MSEVTSSQNVNSSNNVTGGVDYDSGPYTITFFAGQSTTLFEISINDDNIFEASETFSITIDQSSLPNRVILASSTPLTTTILDDDCK